MVEQRSPQFLGSTNAKIIWVHFIAEKNNSTKMTCLCSNIPSWKTKYCPILAVACVQTNDILTFAKEVLVVVGELYCRYMSVCTTFWFVDVTVLTESVFLCLQIHIISS